MAERNFNIKVDGAAFDGDMQRSGISTSKKAFDRDVYENNKAVEELDRYDDFGFFKIDPSAYASDGGEYGIPVRRGFNDDVILGHQRVAALSFLRDLRGFGLLADVVGSGKTYEACVVLSELAARDKLHSILLIIPDQVYNTWKEVLEVQFGLGKGVLYEAGRNLDAGSIECDHVGDGILRPRRPMIVKTEDFVTWHEDAQRLLFDVIVVDEAHHLCAEEGRYAKAMKLLSLMIQTKKKADSTYCLLLSATPHTGNLEHMFRLWYFIRCSGGNPSDFDEKDDMKRSEQYRKEKEYYKNHICYGATTVMEFIKKVKMKVVAEEYSAEFEKYLAREKVRPENFEKLTEGERFLYVQGFLKDNAEIRKNVLDRVASAYHNGVLRSIMIRQPNTIAKSKVLDNYLFFPMAEEPGVIRTEGILGDKVEVDLADLYSDTAVRTQDGEKMSLRKYLEDNRGNREFTQVYAEMLSAHVINKVGTPESIFTKKNSGTYYGSQMGQINPDEARYRLVPYKYEADGFAHKMAVAKEILAKHEGKRVLVFFDYDVKDPSAVAKRFEEELKADERFAKRLLVGGALNKSRTVEKFNKTENAVLVVEDPSFTEGVNLQASSTIINFEVTPDPLSMDQRIGRIFRLGQTEKQVHIYSLADMNRLEGYVLMYFLRIGLMFSNSGDATIIAGSNSERMVTVRCPACKSVRLYSLEDYEAKKKKGELYCKETPLCRQYDPKGTLMEEISVYDFKCGDCGKVFARSVTEEGYMCLAANNGSGGIMRNSGEAGDRSVYCSKICAMSHCSFFKKQCKENGDDWCPALKAYRETPEIGDADLDFLCYNCPNRYECPDECKLWVKGGGGLVKGKRAIKACGSCEYAECHPKPHVLSFNEKWEADCPVCGKGTLRPIVARTFATYIRAAWKYEHDGGAAFCNNLLAEADKVADIKEILANDRTD